MFCFQTKFAAGVVRRSSQLLGTVTLPTATWRPLNGWTQKAQDNNYNHVQSSLLKASFIHFISVFFILFI
jgi:hypothetical protein